MLCRYYDSAGSLYIKHCTNFPLEKGKIYMLGKVYMKNGKIYMKKCLLGDYS